MKKLLNKKSKKSSSSSQSTLSLGIPTNVITGPLGFRTELGVPGGEQRRPYRHLEEDAPDLTIVLDGNDTRVSRIVSYDKESEREEPPVPGTSTAGVVLSCDGPGTSLEGERF